MNLPATLPRSPEMLEQLRREFEHRLSGYLYGKSAMRDYLVSEFCLSELAAEELIDGWERTSWLQFAGDPTKASHRGALWKFASPTRTHRTR